MSDMRLELRRMVVLAAAGCIAGAAAAAPFAAPAWIDRAQAVLDRTPDYTAIFHKQVRLGDALRPEEVMRMKFAKPFRIYLRWIDRACDGEEALYAEGWNGNRLRFHKGGLLGIVNVNVDPHGKLAMGGNRHPITEAGLGYLVRTIGDNIHRAVTAGEYTERDLGRRVTFGRTCLGLEAIFPADPARGYYSRRAILDLDVERSIPVRIQIFDFTDRLIEDYGYEQLVLGAGLTDQDFAPGNPAYRF